MTENLLLIQPRWLFGAALLGNLRGVAAQYPRATITLLAASPLDEACRSVFGSVEFIAMPDLWGAPKAELKSALRRVRARRYEAAMVLAGPRCLQVGCHELMFWAAAARASKRCLSEGTAFGRRAAFGPLARRIGRHVAGRVLERAVKKLRPTLLVRADDTARCRRRLLTHLYLRQHDQLRGARRGVLRADGANFDLETARDWGWQIAPDETSEATLIVLCDHKAASLSTIATGVVLLQNVEAKAVAQRSDAWTLLREDESFAAPGRVDAWLFHENSA